MRKTKRFLALILAVCLLISVVVITTGCRKVDLSVVEADPEGYITDSIKLTMEALKARGSSSPVAYIADALQRGAITVEYGDAETMLYSNTMYFNSKDNMFVNEFTTTAPDAKTAVTLYANNEDLAITLPDSMGGKTVGICYETILADAKDADILWSELGITYEDFCAKYGETIKQLNSKNKKLDIIELLELKGTLDKAKKIIKKCDVEVESRKVVTGAADVDAILITYTLSTEELGKLLELVGEWTDDSLANVMSNLGLTDLVPMMGDPAKELEAILTELQKAITETDANVKVSFAISPKSKLLMRADCVIENTIDDTKEYITVNLDLGQDLRKSSEYQINFLSSSGIDAAASTFTIGYQFNDYEGMYSRRLYTRILEDGEETLVELVYKQNVVSDIYTLTYDSVDTNVVIAGDCEVKEGEIRASIDSVTVDREKTEVGVRFLIDRSAKCPKMPQYRNFFALTDDEVENIFDVLSEFTTFETFFN